MITTQSDEQIKSSVRSKYAEIALQSKEENAHSCCGSGPQGTYNIMSDSYEELKGYNPDADLGLGCGLPTEFARIQPGDTVLDLGSGAGNDCFVARAETGAEGKVLGVDFTPEMIRKARENADRLGFNNVEFREGDIENLPVSDNSVDVVVSNCVLNLVPNKPAVFGQIMRVLKPGGHFSISDVVLRGELPDALRESAEMYAGCVAGAIQMEDYLELIRDAGFQNLMVQKQKPILIPDEILLAYLSEEEIRSFVDSGTGIFSITVFAEKPGTKSAKPKVNLLELATMSKGCSPGSGCC
jgi:SAM-dependent methyltransferase